MFYLISIQTMPSSYNEILTITAQYKDAIVAIITWLWWSIAHVIHRWLNGEKMSFKQHLSHLFLSWFVWYISYLWCNYMDIIWPLQGIIIWMASYSGIKIIEAFNMFQAKTIYNLILEFIKFKVWKK